jgi:hypothetical protein
LLKEKILLRFLVCFFLRFSEEAVKKEPKPPPTDFRSGLEISTKEDSDDDDFRLLVFRGDRLRLLLLW